MKTFDILRLLDPRVTPQNCKIHMAVHNGTSDPYDEFLAGDFDEWQSWQGRRNFDRQFVLSLIQLSQGDHWLFAGFYESTDAVWHEDHQQYKYALTKQCSCAELQGRLISIYPKTFRQPYPNGETVAEQLLIAQVLSEPVSIGLFPGYRNVDISALELRMIVNQNLESWRSALSSVAGVYLISNGANGHLYVGSASGQGGIWQRWCDYAASGHGGNVGLIELHDPASPTVPDLRFSILEIADVHTSQADVIAREVHWKNVLLTRGPRGLNRN